ncbi:M20/M25/M40 family metallo-hydrolase [Nocardia seriolae]|uniref:Peptidase n=1 Tax=Nocardia seriolae TaxID=37332 RepID=A0ABC8ASK1_9NOCA|nr:M20/M25/M40 family metallo-hydrolase [Nocardia seriolae]APA97191.1 putative carboxypeptidase PM20D1.1 [Nocardia seriolae]WNJ61373.1 M20/M25/M40 family metallo-hydrolase [Nocardia seriolae]BEK97446.1 M20 family peptidase [Nocardia seriolae]GAM47242.1 peptidase [Nocardia seriolae]GAP29149.1 peptidase [Nocardia seriolae]
MTRTAPSGGPAVDEVTAERLAAALRCRTVSHEERDRIDPAEFDRLTAHLEHSFPLVHTHLTWETFGHSRLYRWAGAKTPAQPQSPRLDSTVTAFATAETATTRTGAARPDGSPAGSSGGSDASATGPDAEPVAAILLAHMDVVPVDDVDGWTHPPFAGVVDDEFVWGRGAIDDKSRVVAIFEAVEQALEAGVMPGQTVYLAFGHDEEVFGAGGAGRMAQRLRESGVRARLLLDEGGVITTGMADGIDLPVATIMVGEKGFATVRLSVADVGGHSSMPGRQTAVGRLARAVTRIQDHPFPLRLTPVAIDMLLRVRHFVSEPRRTLLGLVNTMGPVVTRVLAARPQTEALVRTTTAPTVIRGGVKPNVLPQRAEAFVNFRILTGDSVAGVLAHCRKVVRDKSVTIELDGTCSEPSANPAAGPDFELIADLAREVVPGIAVTVGVVPGATDSRYYDDLAATRCNFAPIVLNAADLERIHGTDERISRADYARLIRFNRLLIDRLARFGE